MRTVRVSELKRWLKCRRSAHLTYQLGYYGSGIEAEIGTYVHALLAEYYSGSFPFHTEEVNPEVLATGDAMFNTYVVEVEGEGLDIGQRTMHVESRFEAEVGGVTLSGGVDHIYHDEILNGVVIRDHKTVGRWAPPAQRDYQLMTYAWLARENGIGDIVAFEHNQIKRNKRTPAAKGPFITRFQHPIRDTTLDKWGQMLSYQAIEYRNVTDAAEQTGMGVEHPQLYAIGANDCEFSCSFKDEVCGMIDEGGDYQDVLKTEFANVLE